MDGSVARIGVKVMLWIAIVVEEQLSEKGSCGGLPSLFLLHHSNLQSPIDIENSPAPLNPSEALLNLYKILLSLF